MPALHRLWFNFRVAVEAVLQHRLRALLTGLGIFFGVAAVIAMLAIGTGARQAILEQMKLIGTHNIVVRALVPSQDASAPARAGEQQAADKRPRSPGLRLADAEALAQVLPTVAALSPELEVATTLARGGRWMKSRTIGVTHAFFEINSLRIVAGRPFHFVEEERAMPVCILGKHVARQLFPDTSPLGRQIKCGKSWFRVVGILEGFDAQAETRQELGIRNHNDEVYVPIRAALLYLKDRSRIGKDDIGRPGQDEPPPEENYHQLDRLVVHLRDAAHLRSTATLVAAILKRRHQGVADYEVRVPELLLEQQQRTQETFNLVLAAIAAISLLVGGIGIMNIMLASVWERIKEIGLRRSLGATERDIVQQFLLEAVFISLAGGLLGIAAGIVAARLIAHTADIPTVVTPWSILLSFGVAAATGLLFGLMPARKAARQDPIKALRTE